jgi:DNA-binding NarL/FixJ family response regulator
MNKARILLVDDHAMVRDGLRRLIGAEPDLEVVGEAGNGNEALARIAELRPDVVLMDISMPELNGMRLMEELRRERPLPRVLVLTAFAEVAYLRQLLAAGAAGYLLKRASAQELIDAIRTVRAGGTYLDPAVAGKVVSGFVEHKEVRGARGGHELSERELEVLRKVARGFTNKEISAELGISVKTVETHKANLMEKLGLRSRAEIVRYALQRGWLGDG